MVVEFGGGLVRWSQVGERLWLDAGGRYHFDMPVGWSLGETHPDLLRVVSEILVGRWVGGLLRGWRGSRRAGSRGGGGGGTDSMAALLVLPADTALVYHERDFVSRLRHDNAVRLFGVVERRWGRGVVRVRSDHELIRVRDGLKPGFTQDMAVIAHVLLLADYLGLDSVATGINLGSAYFDRGLRFRDFAESGLYRTMAPRLASIGLGFSSPVAGLHGAATLRVCDDEGLADLAVGCVRGERGETCGVCRKCFRTDARLGRRITVTPDVRHALMGGPTMAAATYLQVVQAAARFRRLPRVIRRHPLVREYLHTDLSFFDRYYPSALEVVHQSHREHVHARLAHYLEPMAEPYRVEELDFYTGSSAA